MVIPKEGKTENQRTSTNPQLCSGIFFLFYSFQGKRKVNIQQFRRYSTCELSYTHKFQVVSFILPLGLHQLHPARSRFYPSFPSAQLRVRERLRRPIVHAPNTAARRTKPIIQFRFRFGTRLNCSFLTISTCFVPFPSHPQTTNRNVDISTDRETWITVL